MIMPKKRGKWTLDEVIITAKESENYTVWCKKYPGAISFCRKNIIFYKKGVTIRQNYSQNFTIKKESFTQLLAIKNGQYI